MITTHQPCTLPYMLMIWKEHVEVPSTGADSKPCPDAIEVSKSSSIE